MFFPQNSSPGVQDFESDSDSEADSGKPFQSRCSENFNSEDAELTYESCDRVQFRVHIIYLQTHSGVLPPPPTALLEDVVRLPEESSTLERLFHFIYPRPQVKLDMRLEPEELWKLAEASEKYQIYPAMYACQIRMKFMLPNFAPYVLAHALKHDYKELANQAAPSALDTKPQDMISILPPPFYEVWFTYYDFWLGMQRRLASECRDHSLVLPLTKSLSGLDDLKATLNGQSYDKGWLDPYCKEILQNRYITRLLERRDDDHWRTHAIMDAPWPYAVGKICLTSKDGELFWIKRDILVASAPKLISPANSNDDPIEITSTSSILDLLLQFLQPRSAPDIGGLPFKELEDLSYIAENFSIFQAMSVCHFFMKKTVSPSSPHNWAVFQYAARHGYKDIMDLVAPHALDQPYNDQTEHLSTSLVASCSKFRQHWQSLLHQIATKILIDAAVVQGYIDGYGPMNGICPTCHQVFIGIHVSPTIVKILQPHNISSVQLLLESGASSGCERSKSIFQSSFGTFKDLIKAMPPFSTYLE